MRFSTMKNMDTHDYHVANIPLHTRQFILKMAKWLVQSYTQTPVYGNGCVIGAGVLLAFSLINNRSHIQHKHNSTKSSIAIDRAEKFSLREKENNTATMCAVYTVRALAYKRWLYAEERKIIRTAWSCCFDMKMSTFPQTFSLSLFRRQRRKNERKHRS